MAAPGLSGYFAPQALLPDGWAEAVRIEVDPDGHIAAIHSHARQAADDELVRGAIVPGMPNLHSHAFQRAMAGMTERAGPGGDDFWAWRDTMYRFLQVVGPDELETIAAFVYMEMLEAGYTSVAEFHYLHHDPSGAPYANPAEMAERIIAAASHSGIGLTLLPVLYQHAGFGAQAAQPRQRRFLHDVEAFTRLLQQLGARMPGTMRLGVAPHSLRAVDAAALAAVQHFMAALDGDAPWHIHAAEQEQEVAECLAATGLRPVQWLLEHAPLSPRWCVVHATHMTDGETLQLARSGAIAGLCPTTEADLGDGLFDIERFFNADGGFGVGGDSHVGIDPFQELRLLEYGQRLTKRRRNLSGVMPGDSVGASLFRRALEGGRSALALPVGRLALGQRADWLVFDAQAPALAGLGGDDLLDGAIFGPYHRPVRDVMVRGIWQVRDGVHRMREVIAPRYAALMRRLRADA